MKKFLSLLLALAMLLGMTLTATAATAGQLVDGNNEIELPWDTDEASVFTYTATQTGMLYISAVDFLCAIGDYDYADNTENMREWRVYTLLTVDGQQLDGGYYGSLEVVAGQTYTISWAHSEEVVHQRWYELGWKAVLNLSYTDENLPKVGTETMPVELYITDCPTDSIEVPAGGTVWYVLYDFNDAELVITGENAYVDMLATNENLEQEELHIAAENGVVTVPISGYRALIQIGNKGDAPAVFGLNCQYPLGGEKNPDTLVLGENVAEVKANNYDGYTYEWTAECNGVLTLTMPEKNWMMIVYNMSTGEDGTWFDSTGESTITVEVHKGNVYWINVNYINEKTFAFPGGDVIFTASVAYDHNYVDGVCQHCGGEEVLYELGDVNGDGKINSRDARLLLRYLAGLCGEDELILDAADFTGDSRVNVRDARAILNHIAGVG